MDPHNGLKLMEDPTPVRADSTLGARILMVNHAGEHGAICIYTGQIIAAWITARDMVNELEEFKAHEKRHRAVFWAELQRRGQRSEERRVGKEC